MGKITLRIWVLIIILVFSLIAIFGLPPKFMQKGVLISSVESNSTAFNAGLRQGQIITAIDGDKISNLDEFTQAIKDKYPSQEKVKTVFTTNEVEAIIFTNETPEITVAEISKTNIKTGLDLAGGARALIQAKDKKLTASEVQDLIDVVSNRLNVYGIADMNILPVSDLAGNNYMLIEIAGATPEDLEELVSQQGKFEAKIANETVFIGGNRDITSVCRNDATCSGIERCSQTQDGGYACRFRFGIYLSEAAAKRHAEATKDLDVNVTTQGNYLTEKLDLYVDDSLMSSLLIGESLKGQVTTQIEISGSGIGETNEEAYNDAESEMRKLQTILITGSLPYKLEIVKLDTISPVLGQQFIKSIILAGIAAIVAVAIIVFIRYRKLKSSLALLITSLSEVLIILGIASFIDWNLDLPSIAGILATIGTGIDSQIIVLDEARQTTVLSIKQKLKRAFAIILGAYFTALVALLPLLWAGAGLLKGFAITTIIGITVGVLITRPAFTDMIKNIEE
jgi:preprotein translocase subunit SecD